MHGRVVYYESTNKFFMCLRRTSGFDGMKWSFRAKFLFSHNILHILLVKDHVILSKAEVLPQTVVRKICSLIYNKQLVRV